MYILYLSDSVTQERNQQMLVKINNRYCKSIISSILSKPPLENSQWLTPRGAVNTIQIIEQSAQRILDTQPDATVRIRLLRDVLRLPAQDEVLLNAQQDVTKSRWVQELVQEQQSDGSWGRLHSRDSRARTRIVTTEVGVERALAIF